MSWLANNFCNYFPLLFRTIFFSFSFLFVISQSHISFSVLTNTVEYLQISTPYLSITCPLTLLVIYPCNCIYQYEQGLLGSLFNPPSKNFICLHYNNFGIPNGRKTFVNYHHDICYGLIHFIMLYMPYSKSVKQSKYIKIFQGTYQYQMSPSPRNYNNTAPHVVSGSTL